MVTFLYLGRFVQRGVLKKRHHNMHNLGKWYAYIINGHIGINA